MILSWFKRVCSHKQASLPPPDSERKYHKKPWVEIGFNGNNEIYNYLSLFHRKSKPKAEAEQKPVTTPPTKHTASPAENQKAEEATGKGKQEPLMSELQAP